MGSEAKLRFRAVQRLKGHRGYVNACALYIDQDPDERRLCATASSDCTAAVWCTTSGRLLNRLVHQNPVRCCCFVKVGPHLLVATVSDESRDEIKLWLALEEHSSVWATTSLDGSVARLYSEGDAIASDMITVDFHDGRRYKLTIGPTSNDENPAAEFQRKRARQIHNQTELRFVWNQVERQKRESTVKEQDDGTIAVVLAGSSKVKLVESIHGPVSQLKLILNDTVLLIADAGEGVIQAYDLETGEDWVYEPATIFDSHSAAISGLAVFQTTIASASLDSTCFISELEGPTRE